MKMKCWYGWTSLFLAILTTNNVLGIAIVGKQMVLLLCAIYKINVNHLSSPPEDDEDSSASGSASGNAKLS